jgi:hypothetical protein
MLIKYQLFFLQPSTNEAKTADRLQRNFDDPVNPE